MEYFHKQILVSMRDLEWHFNPSRVVPVFLLFYPSDATKFLKVENHSFLKNCSEICKNCCFPTCSKYVSNCNNPCSTLVMRDLNLGSHLFEIKHILRKSRFVIFLKIGCSCMFSHRLSNSALITHSKKTRKSGQIFSESSAQKIS